MLRHTVTQRYYHAASHNGAALFASSAEIFRLETPRLGTSSLETFRLEASRLETSRIETSRLETYVLRGLAVPLPDREGRDCAPCHRKVCPCQHNCDLC